MRHRELSTAVLQWLTYADGQACALHVHHCMCTACAPLHVHHCMCTACALHVHHCMHTAYTLARTLCTHTAPLLSAGRRAAAR
eukprot:scaffold34766_cov54-Phaeocystis_antarctica.AAC.3